ncbi:conjugal transfer pilus assembly protein TrbC [Pantoea sp. AN62]|uniref:type-F conjugative transfer system pilin assembly protein TrbC n=1 Tax=Pantoea TaxID=53335 RepID=UPI000A2604F6|nr:MULTISPECIES: type-F conjugative transfer system pilin assembly protein TrbC [Pantoea]MDU4747874.1 type-F conjugative transfer system pilin assembly protein TrbC [Pantoea sp.]HCR0227214.1 type-F conjugative transfer system pilin assembly protein TrbC [Enterobacter kobei]ORM54108.1 type-F conjugative transfer system pilin assembly protein TrbC [Pantoea brenneri]OXM21232.1 type-F conjugative transfer system pilin assembly protein TrbC [Pantoea sp. AV62]HCR0505833.1 type-F conjugative transfer
MKKTLITALLAGAALLCAEMANAAEQPTVSGSDMAYMKQQQRDLELFKSQLKGMNITLPDAQQGRVAQLQNEIAAAQADQNSASRPTPRAVYFVSLGIPEEGLLPMLADARRFGIPATLRGLLNNDFRQTAETMFELSKKDKQAGVQIDPTLYEQYGIKAVPALVVTCGSRFDVLYGSLPVKQALEEVKQRGDCSSTAAQILQGTEVTK